MKRASLWLLVAAVAAAIPVYHLAAQGASTQKPAAPVATPGAATQKPAAPPSVPATTAKPAGAARTVELIASDTGGKYVFQPPTIDAKPGEQIRLVLKAVGTMPKMASAHNFVLLKAGTPIPAFVNEGATAGAATGYIAPARKDAVLAQTPLAGAGETFEVTFTAPTTPGSYPYICTFPGHFLLGMRGMLVVK